MLKLPDSAPPAAGEVHVHEFELDLDAAQLEQLKPLLSPEELLRAERLLSRQKRDRFVAGRGVLRMILGHYARTAPEAIRLASAEHGKPFIAAGTAGNSLRFNLSHTGSRALVAVAVQCEVGVDLELVRDDLPFLDMAKRFFSTSEQGDLISLPSPLQLSAFFRCWTRKEAYIKACGTGFSQPANSFSVSILADQPAALIAHDAMPAETLRWTLRDLPAKKGYCAALATEGAICSVQYFGARFNAGNGPHVPSIFVEATG